MVLALYGAGAVGRECKFLADECGSWEKIVFIDDLATGELLGCPILSFKDFKAQYSPQQAQFIITLGEPRFHKEKYEKMKAAGYTGAVLKDPSVFIAPDAQIGEACVLMRGVSLGSQAKVGNNLMAFANAHIGHDAMLEDHVQVGIGAFIGGHTVVEEGVHVGHLSMITDRIKLGKNCLIAPSAAVFEEVPENATVIGNPGRVSSVGEQAPLFAPSAQVIKKQEEDSSVTIQEKYWDVFSGVFEGIDFNPVTFRFRDDGWDSITHMTLIFALENAFGISLKGRATLRLNSYQAGLQIVRQKLEEKDKGKE